MEEAVCRRLIPIGTCLFSTGSEGRALPSTAGILPGWMADLSWTRFQPAVSNSWDLSWTRAQPVVSSSLVPAGWGSIQHAIPPYHVNMVESRGKCDDGSFSVVKGGGQCFKALLKIVVYRSLSLSIYIYRAVSDHRCLTTRLVAMCTYSRQGFKAPLLLRIIGL